MSAPAPAIVFIGFMGAGKTTAARAAAAALHVRAVDADQACVSWSTWTVWFAVPGPNALLTVATIFCALS